MPFTVSTIGAQADTTAQSEMTCQMSRAPLDNELVLVSVLVSDTAGTPVEPSSVSAGGLIFSLVTSSVTHNTIASGIHNLSVWRGMGTGLSASILSAAFPNPTTGCAILIDGVLGVDTSGTSGSGAVGKSATSRVDASTLTILAPAATDPDNAWWAVATGPGTSAESVGEKTEKFTEIQRAGYSTPQSDIISAWTTLASCNSVTVAGGGSDERGGIMVELVLAPAGAAGSVGLPLGRTFRLVTVPSAITGPVGNLLRLWERQLNGEAYISRFSGTDPNTSGITGIPGQLVVNVGSTSSMTRLWVMAGSVASISTTSWHPCRVA